MQTLGNTRSDNESEYNFGGARISHIANRYARSISTRGRDNENVRSPSGKNAMSQRDAANANTHPTTLSRSVTALRMYMHTSRCTFALCRAKSGLGPVDLPLNARHKGSIGFVIVIVKTIIRHALMNLMLARTCLWLMQYALCRMMPRAKWAFPRTPRSLRRPWLRSMYVGGLFEGPTQFGSRSAERRKKRARERKIREGY